jgi:amidophosphoribosyltransferase
MMQSQQIRAQDSTGIAIYGNGSCINDNNNISIAYNDSYSDVANAYGSGSLTFKIGYLRKDSNGEFKSFEDQASAKDVDACLQKLRQDPNILITSFGKEMVLLKNIGLVKDLDSVYGIRKIRGSHGIGHLRIATSSRVALYNAHPFSTTIVPDLAIVHNGEITNYPKLRSSLELKGYPFYSNCDSEVIAVFIADQMLMHGDIEKAHNEFVKQADGPFTYIAATGSSIALVRDRFGSRKGIVGYNPGSNNDKNNKKTDVSHPPFWAMATDLSALDLVGATYNIETPKPGKPKIIYRRR